MWTHLPSLRIGDKNSAPVITTGVLFLFTTITTFGTLGLSKIFRTFTTFTTFEVFQALERATPLKKCKKKVDFQEIPGKNWK